MGGACPLRPRPLLRLPASAAGGGRLCSCSNPLSASRKISYKIKKVAPKWVLPLVRPGGFEPLAFGVGELLQTGKYHDTAPEIVWCAQLPALFVVVIKECRDVKNDIRNRLGRRSGQMVVRSGIYNSLRFLKRNLFVLNKTVSYYQEHHVK